MKLYRFVLVCTALTCLIVSVYTYISPARFFPGDSFKMYWNTPITVSKAGVLSVLPSTVLVVNGVSIGATNSVHVNPGDTIVHTYPVDVVKYEVISGEVFISSVLTNWPIIATFAIGFIYFTLLIVVSLNAYATYSARNFGYYTLWAFVGWVIVMGTTYGVINSTESVYKSPASGIPTEIGPGEYALLSEPATVTIWGLGEQFTITFPTDMMTLQSLPVENVPTQYAFSAHLEPGTWQNTSSISLSVLPSEDATAQRVEDIKIEDYLSFVLVELVIGLFFGGIIAWELFN